MIERHSPENCPMFNEKTRKIMMASNDKFDKLAKKYGVKMIGSWAVPNEHLGFDVFEAPSLEAVTKLMMEPALMALGAFETCEIKAAFSSEELTKMMPKLAK
jgi:uncharacterized protein with GYD domain